jgi:hypothetical protein
MRQPHPESHYAHLRKSTLDIMRAMNARASFAVPGGSTGDLRDFVPEVQNQSGDETGRLATLATRLLALHGSFAAKGLRGVRDENDNSVALGLALRCAELMRERE